MAVLHDSCLQACQPVQRLQFTRSQQFSAFILTLKVGDMQPVQQQDKSN